jgi:tryptophan halogenase
MDTDPGQVERITFVGGGDAGLLTALALEEGLAGGQVTVVDDFEAPIPEVGKSTLSNVAAFLHDRLGIDTRRLWSEVELAWKTTVYFEDWCGVDPFHSPLGQTIPIVRKENTRNDGDSPVLGLRPDHEDEFHEYYYRYEEGDFSSIYGEVAETPGKAPILINRDNGGASARKALPSFSYHFDSRSLNEFLRSLCRERGIELVNDRITDVTVTDGRIESITGEAAEYRADLYVDASGFKRLLIEELGTEFVEFDLPVDSAVVAKADIPVSEVVSATVVTSGDAGWFWQIDTFAGEDGHRDLGYVYSSAHLSDEAAREEFVNTRDENIDSEDTRTYRFESGVVAEPWRTNCVAVGNAVGFVEPLQSTALSAHCKTAVELTRALAKHGRVNCKGVRRMYNETTRATWEEAYDFISIYYKYSSGDTPFWEDAREVNPGELDHYRTYQDSGFSGWQELAHLTRTGTDLNGYELYYITFRNLGVESTCYEQLDLDVDPEIADHIESYTDSLPDRVADFASYEELASTFPRLLGNAQ